MRGMPHVPTLHESKAADDSQDLISDWQPFQSKEDKTLEALIRKHHRDIQLMQDQQDKLDTILVWFFFLLVVLCGLDFLIYWHW